MANPTLTGTVQSSTDGSATNHTYSFNMDGTGSNLMLFVAASCSAGAGNPTTCTWNGVTMDVIQQYDGVETCNSALYALAAPDSGEHNLVVSNSGSRLSAVLFFMFKDCVQTTYIDQGPGTSHANAGLTFTSATLTSSATSLYLATAQILPSTTITALTGTLIGTPFNTGISNIYLTAVSLPCTGGADVTVLSYGITSSNTDSIDVSIKGNATAASGGGLRTLKSLLGVGI